MYINYKRTWSNLNLQWSENSIILLPTFTVSKDTGFSAARCTTSSPIKCSIQFNFTYREGSPTTVQALSSPLEVMRKI